MHSVHPCYDGAMVNNALLKQLQEAQVIIVMEEGLRKPAEQARHELDRMNAFHMISGMLLIACMIFVLLSSWLDSLSSSVRQETDKDAQETGGGIRREGGCLPQ